MSTDLKETRETLYRKGVKVAIRFQPSEENGVVDKTHTLYGGLTNLSIIAVPAPLVVNKGEKTVSELFTQDELKVLAEDLFDPTIVNPTSAFWKEYAKDANGMTIGKFPINLDKSGLLLEMDKPLDVIYHRILINSPIVAKDRDSIYNKKTYRFYAVDFEDMHKDKLKNINIKKQAFILFGKIDDNKEVVLHILNSLGILVDEKSDLDFLSSTLFDEVEKNPGLFVNIASDKYLKMKMVIGKLVAAGLILVKNDLYYSADGNVPLTATDGGFNDLEGAAAYLSSDMGQELYLLLTASYKKMKTQQ